MERTTMEIIKWDKDKKILFFKLNSTLYKAKIISYQQGIITLYIFNTNQVITTDLKGFSEAEDPDINFSVIHSPIGGQVITIHAKVGDLVKKDRPMVTIESMKMENEITAPFDLFIQNISIAEGDLVKQNQKLLEIDIKK